MSEAYREPSPAALPPCAAESVTGHCSTCADEGREARVIALLADGFAAAQIDGVIEEVALDLVDGVQPGDRLLVHAGVALARLGP